MPVFGAVLQSKGFAIESGFDVFFGRQKAAHLLRK
jgi:hypothetical protein